MDTMLELPTDVARRFTGEARPEGLERVRRALERLHPPEAGWRTRVRTEPGVIELRRGLATGYDVALRPIGAGSAEAGGTPGSAPTTLVVEAEARILGAVAVPVFLVLWIGGSILAIVVGEPIFGALVRTSKLWLFGGVLVAALALATGTALFTERLLTVGKGNPFRQEALRREVLDAVAAAIGIRAASR